MLCSQQPAPSESLAQTTDWVVDVGPPAGWTYLLLLLLLSSL